MITVAIVAILASVALPSYRDYVRRGKLQEAFSELATMRVKLEQHYEDYRNYGTSATACPADVAVPSSTHFVYACGWGDGASTQGFKLSATGKGDLSGYTYTVDQDNAQVSVKVDSQTVNKPCWVMRPGDSCF